jgi:hypothetical protein
MKKEDSKKVLPSLALLLWLPLHPHHAIASVIAIAQ